LLEAAAAGHNEANGKQPPEKPRAGAKT
jgi:hypothetical protein